MNQFLTTVVSCMCLLAYLPVINSSLRQIRNREVMITQWRMFNMQVTRFTGVAAIVYGVFQGLRGMIIVTGAFMAISETEVRIVILAYFLGWLLSQAGIALARRIQVGEADFEVGPSGFKSPFVIDGTLVPYEPTDDEEAPDIIYLPPVNDAVDPDSE